MSLLALLKNVTIGSKNKVIEKQILFIVFILFLNLNKITSILSIIILFLYGIANIERSLKAIMYSFLISQLNTSIFNSNIGELRTLLNLLLIINILLNKKTINNIKKNKISLIISIYCIYIIISSIFISWLPLVSIFKVIYFSTGFLAIFISVRINKTNNLVCWINRYFRVVTSINLILIFFPQGYSTNKVALNGIFANPNGLGIVTVLGCSIFLYSNIKDINRYNTIFIFISIIEIFMSDSRTSIITLVIILLYYFFILKPITFHYNSKELFKYLGLGCLISSVLIILVLVYKNNFTNLFTSKLLKGQTTDTILYSREGQINEFKNDFYSNKLFGVGFGVDGANGRIQSFELKLSYPVERGNIVLAILSETGIIGMIIFGVLIFYLFYYARKENNTKEYLYKLIFIIVIILISFGEMTFFSTNSLGVVQWFLIALFTNKINLSN